MKASNQHEADVLVSILNLLVEKMEDDVDEYGFGYNPKTLEISCPDGNEEMLECLWNHYRTRI